MKLTVEGGSFRYPGGTRDILREMSFSVDSGELLAILGPNGAGKTTLLRCIMGLLRWNAGQSLLDGRDVRRYSTRELWRAVSYVPQARSVQMPYTVEELVLLGRTARIGRLSLPGAEDLRAAEAAMERLHVAHLRARRCAELSGGERQLALIARALAAEPQVLILDEPESNLDFRNQLLVLDAMSGLASEGMTCVFNTHYPAHALRRATHALMLSPGGAYRFGSASSVVTAESIGAVFGVEAVIGQVETDGNIYEDVIPVAIGRGTAEVSGDARVIAGITIIAPDRGEAESLNELLHAYSDDLVGRMGMPYGRAGVHIIHLTLDAPASRVRELTARLNRLPRLSVKTTYAKTLTPETPGETRET